MRELRAAPLRAAPGRVLLRCPTGPVPPCVAAWLHGRPPASCTRSMPACSGWSGADRTKSAHQATPWWTVAAFAPNGAVISSGRTRPIAANRAPSTMLSSMPTGCPWRWWPRPPTSMIYPVASPSAEPRPGRLCQHRPSDRRCRLRQPGQSRMPPQIRSSASDPIAWRQARLRSRHRQACCRECHLLAADEQAPRSPTPLDINRSATTLAEQIIRMLAEADAIDARQ